MPYRVSCPFQARRTLLKHLAPRYQQASPVQKTLLLDSFVEWTGYSRKYAIGLLNHGEHCQQTIERRRLPQYRPPVQQALFLTWKAAHYVCAKRLLPSLPRLVTLLERQGHLQLTEEECHQLLAMSVSTAERFLRTQRKPRVHGLCSISQTCARLPPASLRTWLTALSIAPSARTGATRTVSTVAACAERAFGACLLQLAGSAGVCLRNALSARRRSQSPACPKQWSQRHLSSCCAPVSSRARQEGRMQA